MCHISLHVTVPSSLFFYPLFLKCSIHLLFTTRHPHIKKNKIIYRLFLFNYYLYTVSIPTSYFGCFIAVRTHSTSSTMYIGIFLPAPISARKREKEKKREREMEGKSTLRNPLAYQVLVILLTLLPISTPPTALAATSSSQITYTQNIKTACNSTLYPQLCYKSLSPYASKIKGNPQRLCKTALSIALQAARNASSTVSNVQKQKTLTRYEASVIKDCVVNIKDSIDELKQSLKAMPLLSGSDKEFQMSNIKTWVSAALTDDNTCMDELDGGQKISAAVKNKIRNSVLIVARLTSNALALINTLKI
jgi:pectinesterase inhibitor-like protein